MKEKIIRGRSAVDGELEARLYMAILRIMKSPMLR
jgi:hypothetical protein